MSEVVMVDRWAEVPGLPRERVAARWRGTKIDNATGLLKMSFVADDGRMIDVLFEDTDVELITTTLPAWVELVRLQRAQKTIQASIE